jgi:hypothetical protein
VELERSYSYCPKCEQGFFLLDLELGLLPNTAYTPLLQEGLVRLGTDLPFRQAQAHFQFFSGVKASEASLRRLTHRAGATLVELEEAQVERMEKAPTKVGEVEGPEVAYLSGDGCYVPVVGGEWKEVKTLVIGKIERPVEEKGQVVVHTTQLSYFSRCLPIEEFKRASIGEVQRRGLAQARVVCAPCDGADYLQGLVDFHRADAVRILDFPHAAEHLAEAGQAVLGEGTVAFAEWFEAQCHLMKQTNGKEIIEALEQLRQKVLADTDLAKLAVVERNLNYLKERRHMLRYAYFRELGYPIGSGATESANKIVVEARLKGSGMHWAVGNLNPMLALRNLSCNSRWETDWVRVQKHWSDQIRQQRGLVREQKQKAQAVHSDEASKAPTTDLINPTGAVAAVKVEPALKLEVAAVLAEVAGSSEDKGEGEGEEKKHWRPGPEHPWKRMKIGRARYAPSPDFLNAKN